MDIHPGALHLNEGHSAFAVLEFTRQLMERDGQPFQNVREIAAAMTVFTTHTPVEAGHDRFDAPLIEQVLGSFRRQLNIASDEFLALGRVVPHHREEPFCMTVLGLKMSRARVAVSALHGRISRAMWRNLWPDKSEDEIPIAYITNGVHMSTWLSEPMRQLYDTYLGADWEEQMHDPRTWAAVEAIEDAKFWECDQHLRAHLLDYVRRSVEHQMEARGEAEASLEAARRCLDPSVFTIGFARRFALYKRGDLLFRDLNRLDRLINHPERPVQIIMAGKAHPRDDAGKRTIQRVFQVTRDPRFAGKVVFVENYNMNMGRHLVQGVDLWLNTPRRPLEACGTSGQKVAINAGLNLSILDGWWAEAFDGENGFAIGGRGTFELGASGRDGPGGALPHSGRGGCPAVLRPRRGGDPAPLDRPAEARVAYAGVAFQRAADDAGLYSGLLFAGGGRPDGVAAAGADRSDDGSVNGPVRQSRRRVR